MKCRKCGAELVSGAKFCMMCGTKVSVVCSKCGIELPDNARFCYQCGTEVKKVASKPAVSKPILSQQNMQQLGQVKAQAAEVRRPTGEPVWDTTPSGGTCDCAVGECDCDGSIWN